MALVLALKGELFAFPDLISRVFGRQIAKFFFQWQSHLAMLYLLQTARGCLEPTTRTSEPGSIWFRTAQGQVIGRFADFAPQMVCAASRLLVDQEVPINHDKSRPFHIFLNEVNRAPPRLAVNESVALQ